METIAINEFRANLMNVLKSVEQGMELGITSRGKVIARLLPPENSRKRYYYYLVRHKNKS